MHVNPQTDEAIRSSEGELRQRRPISSRRSDPLRPHRAVTGLDARVRWYNRVFAFFGLVVLVGLLGLGLALLIGLLFLGGSAALEFLAG